ncbi:MAG: DNA-methyltransferase [Methylococcaceae bacterium]
MKTEQIGSATLYLGDCRDILRDIGKIDALISDPPYGIAYKHGEGGGGMKNTNVYTGTIIGDDKPFDPGHLLAISPNKTLLFGANYYAALMPQGKGDWIAWDKVPRGGAHSSFRDVEFMWSSVRTPRNIYRQQWSGAIRSGEGAPSKERRLHVSQKPVEMMMWCIDTLRVPVGGTVLDPYMGSGSTGVAALRKGCRFIGIEIDEGHFITACKRLEREQKHNEHI